jgi:adenosylcobinamide-phosphate synthase
VNVLIFYSVPEMLIMLLCAIILDWLLGDPRWLLHPVIIIGRWISYWEKRLLDRAQHQHQRRNGVVLMLIVTLSTFFIVWGLVATAHWIHPWFGYALNTWLISTTIAIKGLKDAALLVYKPLSRGDIPEARKYTGYIVGRDTDELDEQELSRATVETVAENTVDAVVSPVFFALIGAAPLAMLYRATNTLDSMVGYRNERYLRFGWASARFDDVLNWIPARLTGLMLILVSLLYRHTSAISAYRSILTFAHKHPSPNSGIPEAAVAGCLGIELGGTNRYSGVISERARLGWPHRKIKQDDIIHTIRLLYGVSYIMVGGLLCGICGWLL